MLRHSVQISQLKYWRWRRRRIRRQKQQQNTLILKPMKCHPMEGKKKKEKNITISHFIWFYHFIIPYSGPEQMVSKCVSISVRNLSMRLNSERSALGSRLNRSMQWDLAVKTHWLASLRRLLYQRQREKKKMK